MIEYSSIILILLIILIAFIISKNISINTLRQTHKTLKEQFKSKSLVEGFKTLNGNDNKSTQETENGLFDPKLLVKKTNKFKKIFSNEKYSVWCPEPIDNYHPVGHYITLKNKKPRDFAVLVHGDDVNIKKPKNFSIVAISNNNYGIWKANINDNAYLALGNIYSKDYPSRYSLRMINRKFLVPTDVEKMVLENKSMKNDKGYEVWSIKDSDNFVCNNKNNINEFDSLKNLVTLNPNLLDVKKKLYIKYTLSYKKICSYTDTKLGKDFTVWRPIPPKHFYSLGDIIVKGKTNPNNTVDTIVVHKSFCKFPVNYGVKPVITFKNKEKNGTNWSVWNPDAPPNYAFLGQVVIKNIEEPSNEKLIACIPLDYLDKTSKNTHSLIWNNLNEDQPASLWLSNLNLLAANNKYVPPDINGTRLLRNLTTSDIDIMDNSQSVLFKFKRNPQFNQEVTDVYLKNMIIANISQKFDITEDRLLVDKLNHDTKQITFTIMPRKIESSSITVDDTIKSLQNALNIGDIRIYNEDKSNFIIKLDNAGLINANINEIEIDNADYVNAF